MSDLQGPEKALHISVDLGDEERNVTLIAHVLDEEARIQRGRDLVKAAGDITFDDLPAASRIRLWMLTTVRLSLKDCPAWLNTRMGQHDELLFAIFEEVDALERAYFRRNMGASESNEERATFSISARALPSTL
jgi:hypothetical protein